MGTYRDVLRAILVNDRALVGELAAASVVAQGAPSTARELDPKTGALVRVAALVAIDAPVDTFRWTIGEALDAGAIPDEVVDVLLAVAPLIGVARVAATAPRVALALDYDVDQAIETYE